MKRVKQISFDILIDDSVDGVILAEEVEDILEANGYKVLGAGFQDDLTETYKENYPSLMKEVE